MIPTLSDFDCQRWLNGRASYRPAGEPICTAQYEIASIDDDLTAKRFVLEHHYAASYPAARFRFGLYHKAKLVGVAVFSQPVRNEVLTNIFPCEIQAAAELGRLVLLDDVPANGESYFVARCFELLRRQNMEGILSFSDPVPRTDAEGNQVFRGHYGCVYQSLNAVYLGRATARTLRLLPDGSVLSARAISKFRAWARGEQDPMKIKGWQYVRDSLIRFGAAPCTGEPLAWLENAIQSLTRPLRHLGNHKYCWSLNRKMKRHLPAGQAYPKPTPELFRPMTRLVPADS